MRVQRKRTFGSLALIQGAVTAIEAQINDETPVSGL